MPDSRSPAALLLIAGLTLSCARAMPDPAPAPAGPATAAADTLYIPPLPTPRPDRPEVAEGSGGGVTIRLHEAPHEPVPAGSDEDSIMAGPLAPERAGSLLAQLPPLPLPDTASFRFPAASPPAPRASGIVVSHFPPTDSTAPDAPARRDAQLEVVRIVPTGETELAPHLTITFSDAMVPLTTVEAVERVESPVRLEPEPPGRWTWIDTRTLRFEPVDRFPMATRFVVEIPRGTRSASGATLDRTVRTEFATPTPRVLGAYPALQPEAYQDADRGERARRIFARTSDGAWHVRHDPVIVIAFDQAVDTAAAMRSVQIIADAVPRPVRSATHDDLADDSVALAIIENLEPGRWIAVRPVEPLPAETEVRVVVGGGVASAEGPLASDVVQELRFRTYGPLRIDTVTCGREACRPGDQWILHLTNAIDPETWSPDLIDIEPALLGMEVNQYGSFLRVQAAAVPGTSYRVTLSPRIRDVFAQQLESPHSVAIDIEEAHPFVAINGTPLIVLDPGGPPHVRLQTQGHRRLRVRVHRAEPGQWRDWATALTAWTTNQPPAPPGTVVSSQVIDVPADFTESMIDIGPALRDGLGHAIVTVEPLDSMPRTDPRWRPYHSIAFAWVMATRIGLAATRDDDGVVVWATSLRSGAPLADVDVALMHDASEDSPHRATNEDGIVELEWSGDPAIAIVARSGNDTALLPASPWPTAGGMYWDTQPPGSMAWHVFTDRGLYRPGETAHVKGWLRHTGARGAGIGFAEGTTSLEFDVHGPRGEPLDSGAIAVNALGGFHTTLNIPEQINVGRVQIRLAANGTDPNTRRRTTTERLRIAEFRTPDFEVNVEADPGPYVARDTIAALLTASYYGGGSLAGSPVTWRVNARAAEYSPPGWSEWQFGGAALWWRPPRDPVGRWELSGTTGADGAHGVLIDVLGIEPPFTTAVTAAAQVEDVTRQVGSAEVNVLVHPAAVTVGMRTDRLWLGRGEPADIEVIVVDHDGRAIAAHAVDIAVGRMEAWSAGADSVKFARPVCSVVSRTEPVTCEVRADSAGVHIVRADVRDGAGRVSRTELMLYVAGGATPWLRRQSGDFDILADRAEYEPGDTARLLLQPTFHPAEALVTIDNAGVVSTHRVHIDSATYTFELPITDEHVPGVRMSADLIEAARGIRHARGEVVFRVSPAMRELAVTVQPRDTLVAAGDTVTIDVIVRDAAGRPAAGADVALWMVDEAVLGLGGYELASPLESMYTPLHVVSNDAVHQWVVPWPRSAGPGTLSGILLRHDGEPLPNATVRLVDMDTGIATAFDGSFTLRGVAPGTHVIEVIDPNGVTARMSVDVPAEGAHVGSIVLGPEGLGGARMAGPVELEERVRGAPVLAASRMRLESVVVAAAPPAPPPGVELRTDFATLAFFEPALRTDASGRVQVTAPLPQSLTRYRVMAVAAHGAQQFGKGEAAVTARRDLMVRVTAPRFLNHGDRFELPVLVQNMTRGSMTIELAARATGVTLSGATGRSLTLAPHARAEVRFDAEAELTGTAHVQVVAMSAGGDSDAAAVAIPVYTPATVEAFATYGSLASDEPAVLPISRPHDVIEAFGGLEVSVTSTALHALTDALIYLCLYPFSGSEHIAARVIGVAALRDVLAAFRSAELASAPELIEATERDIGELVARQGRDGGWSMWGGFNESHPWISIHVAHALQRAQERGFHVADEVLAEAAGYLRAIERHTSEWPPKAQQAAMAYALYVRHRIGDAAAVPDARRLAVAVPDRVDGALPVEATAWLLYVLASDTSSRAMVAELERRLLNRLVETAGTVTFAASYEDGEHLLLHSSRRTDAVVLEALMEADADEDVIIRLAQSLLAHRKAGRWLGTQENSWVLLALDRYFRTFEATTPAFDSRVWLGERYAGGHSFEGRTTDRHHIDIPMPQLLNSDADALVIAREGAGRMYYRAALRYAPNDRRSPPVDRGFIVSRLYEAVDDPTDVRRAEDGTWHVRAGATVRVRLTMIAPSVRHHAALVDPLAAAFEPLNPELRGAGFNEPLTVRGPRPRPWWRRPWYEHQNLRDDRAEAFASLLPAGEYEYTYYVRATTPGTFMAPPPRAEMMYMPETFGRGQPDIVVVE